MLASTSPVPQTEELCASELTWDGWRVPLWCEGGEIRVAAGVQDQHCRAPDLRQYCAQLPLERIGLRQLATHLLRCDEHFPEQLQDYPADIVAVCRQAVFLNDHRSCAEQFEGSAFGTHNMVFGDERGGACGKGGRRGPRAATPREI